MAYVSLQIMLKPLKCRGKLKPLAVMVFFFYVRNLLTKLSEKVFFPQPMKMVAWLIGMLIEHTLRCL